MTTIVLAAALVAGKLSHDFFDTPAAKAQAPTVSEPFPVRIMQPLKIEIVTPVSKTAQELDALRSNLDQAQKEADAAQKEAAAVKKELEELKARPGVSRCKIVKVSEPEPVLGNPGLYELVLTFDSKLPNDSGKLLGAIDFGGLACDFPLSPINGIAAGKLTGQLRLAYREAAPDHELTKKEARGGLCPIAPAGLAAALTGRPVEIVLEHYRPSFHVAELTELEAVRAALDDARNEADSSKAEVDRLKQSVADLETKLAVKSVTHRTSGELADYQPKTPTQVESGLYQLKDDSGVTWSNADPVWLTDWVSAIDLRLKRGPNLVPPVVGQKPAAAVAPTMYFQPYSGLQSGCSTGSCPNVQYGRFGGWR